MTKKVKDDQESHKEYLKDVPEMGEVQDNAVPSSGVVSGAVITRE